MGDRDVPPPAPSDGDGEAGDARPSPRSRAPAPAGSCARWGRAPERARRRRRTTPIRACSRVHSPRADVAAGRSLVSAALAHPVVRRRDSASALSRGAEQGVLAEAAAKATGASGSFRDPARSSPGHRDGHRPGPAGRRKRHAGDGAVTFSQREDARPTPECWGGPVRAGPTARSPAEWPGFVVSAICLYRKRTTRSR